MRCMDILDNISVSILFSVLLAAGPISAQSKIGTITQFVGILASDLVPGTANLPLSLERAPEGIRAKLGVAVAADEDVWVADLSVRSRPPQLLYIVSAPGAVRAAIIDSNGDGVFTSEERTKFVIVDQSLGAEEATVWFTSKGAAFSRYPVRLRLNRFVVQALSSVTSQQTKSAPTVMVSIEAFAQGEVKIDGKTIRLQLLVNFTDTAVNPTGTAQYLDCNMDGKFDDDPTSWEVCYNTSPATVFHIGSTERYVSIKSVDVQARTVTLVPRAASEYQRIELRVGSTIPDFFFTAIDGSRRRLSDFRGKYLIIEFWGTWCSPCIREVPFLKRAYETYKDKGLEILGMDKEDPDVTPEDFVKGLAKVKEFVKQNGITWAQAQTESIKPLYETRFQIRAWPTTILLDPKGAIISVNRTNQGEPPLRGEKLLETLAAIFKDK